MWSQGIHARSGVACADCHMPYVRQGAIKISDHHVRSPLLNVERACLVCHPFPASEMKARAELIQERNAKLLDRAEDALIALFDAVKDAKAAGADSLALSRAGVYGLQRRAQWRADFVNAENSMGFHAPQEAARILAEAIDYARQGETAARMLQTHGSVAKR
jgi:nitrite reductase (cytochrome c-552)